jgi:hypothetical protein
MADSIGVACARVRRSDRELLELWHGSLLVARRVSLHGPVDLDTLLAP